jgi:peroxiredoxin Q/BCP
MTKLVALCVVLVIGGVALAALRGRGGEELKPGDPAPGFTLPGSDGKTYTLADLKGKTVVLAWFPKAFTGG